MEHGIKAAEPRESPSLDRESESRRIGFSFQPIVDLASAEVVGHEALVRGPVGEPPADVFGSIEPQGRRRFDQACRHRALKVAGRLNMPGTIHLNCSVLSPDELDQTLASTHSSARAAGIDPRRVVLEFDRLETLGSPTELHEVRKAANRSGLDVLADNFGACEVGLKRLVVFQPQWLKIDRKLVAQVHESEQRQALVAELMATCRMLNIEVIASGVERSEELDWLKQAGVRYAQGYLLGRPVYEAVPAFDPESVGT
jgi:EAL domain-containing protein (putative c-di-GMP-specific phosphodiesterase class I)